MGVGGRKNFRPTVSSTPLKPHLYSPVPNHPRTGLPAPSPAAVAASISAFIDPHVHIQFPATRAVVSAAAADGAAVAAPPAHDSPTSDLSHHLLLQLLAMRHHLRIHHCITYGTKLSYFSHLQRHTQDRMKKAKAAAKAKANADKAKAEAAAAKAKAELEQQAEEEEEAAGDAMDEDQPEYNDEEARGDDNDDDGDEEEE